MKRFLVRALKISGFSIGGLVLGAAILLALTARTSTPPFTDERGTIVEGSIAEERYLDLGGIEQYVLLRGRDRTAPLLIVLHGGPGNTEMPLFRLYNAALEDHFLVVHWDQRAAGKSYSSDIAPSALSVRAYVDDLDQLVDLLRAEFGRDQVVLLAHSWGSLIGVLYTAAHPQKIAAYFGVGQISDTRESERRSYDYVLAAARADGNAEAIAALEEIGPPPHTVDEVVVQRMWLRQFGGAFYRDVDLLDFVLDALGTDEMSWRDVYPFYAGMMLSLEALWDEIGEFDLTASHRRFDVPIVFLLGRHDRQVSADLAARYFADIDAPHKELVWFENSAHSPPFEEPERFNRTVIRLAQDMGIIGAE